MLRYEYKVIPAPRKGTKARGVKTPEARFSLSLEQLMNQMGAEGWQYQRAETLPSDERHGLKSPQTVYRDVLVFRRPLIETTPEAPDATPDEAPLLPVEEPMDAPANDAQPSAIIDFPEDDPEFEDEFETPQKTP